MKLLEMIVQREAVLLNNVTFVVDNISKFAKEHSLNAGALGEVLRGLSSQHKGWKLTLLK